jgi:hypothetical protein
MVMNYLDLVNDVLIRLREDEVTAVTDTSYSKLIGKFVNDAKRQVEDAYNWNALSETLTATTTSGLFNYVMEDSGQRFRVIDVINQQDNSFLEYASTRQMNEWFLNQVSVETGAPRYYNFNGVDASGDTQVDIFPIPDGVYTIFFNIIKPQAALSSSSDVLKVPSEPVIFLALAKALVERGEDTGMTSAEAYQLYQTSLADHIAIESNRYPEELVWLAH